MQKYDVIASIVTYQSPVAGVREAVRSFLATSLRVRLILIDNSSDPEIQKIGEEFGVDYHNVGQNVGFGHGHNIAINRFVNQSSYFLVLNPDVVIQNGCLEILHSFMQAHPQVPLCAPKILNLDHTPQYVHRRLPNFFILFGRRFLPPFVRELLKPKFDYYELRDFDFTSPIQTPCLSGCFMYFRSSSLKQLGGFDPRYFLYMEDYDLSRQASKLGPTVIVTSASILHGWTRASYKNIRYLRMNIVSTLKYFMKWGPNDACEARLFTP